MKKLSTSRSCQRSGLTLIELLVVLTILIALGGIVVSTLPGLLGRTQAATAAANVPEIDSAIRRNMITANGRLGDRFDSLISGTSGIGGEIPAYIGGSEFFVATSLNESEILALAAVGLTSLIPANPSSPDATFDSHRQEAVPIATDSKVCSIANPFATEIMDRLWNLIPPEDARYLIFGLGSRSTLVGGGETALFPEAPVHFSDEAQSGPRNMYSRYLIVVELRSPTGLPARARYVGVAIPGQTGLRGIGDELREVYSSEN